ncbi:hypothetical protein MXD81_08750, partial [Microbacteriaceae bacterium K1510]|nr:hypothetical protein [Microbacteriaceae bacterium K1510]
AEKILKDRSLVDYYDDVVIEGLRLAQNDADRGVLGPERLADIRDTGEIVIETLADWDVAPKKPAARANGQKAGGQNELEPEDTDAEDDELTGLCAADRPVDPAWRTDGAILCVASRTPLDETAGIAFAQLVEKCGLGVKVLDLERLRHGALPEEDAKDIRLIC